MTVGDSLPVQYLTTTQKGAQPRVPVDLKSFESCFEEQHGVPEEELKAPTFN